MPVPTPTADWSRRPVVAVAAMLVASAVAVERLRALLRAPPTDFDDAYMFLRYAKNLLAGFGLRWNRDEAPVFGATSLPHVVAVASLRALSARLSDAAVLQLASGLAAAALLIALALACARFARHPALRGRPVIWAALLWPLVAYSEPFRFHAGTGMDTMLAALANAGLVYAALALAQAPDRRRALAAGIAGYLTYLVRPDNLIYAALVPALCLVLEGPAGWRGRALLVFAATLVVLVSLDLVVKQRLLGSALPLGALAKWPGHYAGFAGEYTWNPFWFLRVFLGALWPVLMALVVCTGRGSGRVVAALLLPAGLGLAALFGVNQIMGHLGRFFFPVLPFWVVAGALAVDRALAPGGPGPTEPAPAAVLSSRARAGWLTIRLGIAAGLLLGGAWALTRAGDRYQSRAATQALAPLDGFTVAARSPLPELDSWRSSEEIATLARAAPAGARLAMSEHGLVGAQAPDAVIIDVLGLHDPAFAREPFRAAELWRRDPELIWMPHPDHTQMVRDILDSDELWARYDFYPDLFSYGVAVRHEDAGPRAAALSALLRARVAASYPGLSLGAYRARRPGER